MTARSNARQVTLIAASTIKPERPEFLLAGRIPLGALTVNAGPPGQGKTTYLAHVAAGVTRGTLAGDLHAKPASVIFASREDSPAQVLVPRLMAAGADLARVHFVTVTEDEAPGDLTLLQDTARLFDAAKPGGAALLVLDPLASYLSGSVNTWKDGDVRRVLAPVAEHAERTRIAVVGVMHLNRAEGREALDRLNGSGAEAVRRLRGAQRLGESRLADRVEAER